MPVAIMCRLQSCGGAPRTPAGRTFYFLRNLSMILARPDQGKYCLTKRTASLQPIRFNPLGGGVADTFAASFGHPRFWTGPGKPSR
jgi:hypothetical protein